MTVAQLSLINDISTNYELSTLYRRAHDMMRNVDGLQPQVSFDELLKFLFFKQANEESHFAVYHFFDFQQSDFCKSGLYSNG